MENIITFPITTLNHLPLQSYYEQMRIPLIERDGWLLPQRFQDVSEEVALLERGQAFIDFSDHGFFRMEGKDAVDLLHRISTNDFKNFKAGDALQTILVTEKGRVVDSVLVVHRADHLLLITSRGANQQVCQWIEKFIIMEDVKVTDVTGQYLLLVVFNSQSTLRNKHNAGADSYHITYFGIDGVFYISEINTKLVEVFQSSQLKQVGYDAYDYFRIRHGIPLYGKEMTGDFNPLELNLWNLVSFTKGCYIGQEVIARLDTYKKIQRQLCLFRTEVRLQADKQYHLKLGEQEVGRLTSVVPDVENQNDSIGLGLVRRDAATAGAKFILDENGTSAIIDLIFKRNYSATKALRHEGFIE